MLRLYVPEIDFVTDLVVTLNDSQRQHVKVRRLNKGDSVVLFHAQTGDWLAHLINDRQVCVQQRLRDPLPCPDLWLVQPLLPKDRFAWIVEKATELGIAALCPITTRYTQAAQINAERTKQHMIEAAQQCERTDIPQLHKTVSLTQLLREWDVTRTLYAAVERSEGTTPLLRHVVPELPLKAAILVGPEGGFAPEERELLQATSFVTCVSLGTRILRSETAALAALAQLG